MVQEEQDGGQRLSTRSGLYLPATSPNVQRAVLLVAVESGLPLYVIDVKDAFLNVPQPGKVVVTAPQQLSGYKGCMWKLNRLLPGQREGTSKWSKLATKLLQASLQSTLLCRAHLRFFAEHSSLQSTLALLCRAHLRFFAEHSSLQSTLALRRAHLRFFAKHTSLQSTLALLCKAHFFAEHTCASLQSTLLCRAHFLFFAERTSLQSTLALLCRAHFFAEHTCASLQSTLPLLCRADQALSLEGASQMNSIPRGRLLTLVRPGNSLVLRRIRNLKRCVQACGCNITTPRYAPPRLHSKRCCALPKEIPFFWNPFFWKPFFFVFVFLALQSLARLKCNLEANCLGVVMLQPQACAQRFRF